MAAFMEHADERMVQQLLRQGMQPGEILNQVFGGRGFGREWMRIFSDQIIQMAHFFPARPEGLPPARTRAAAITAGLVGTPFIAEATRRGLGNAVTFLRSIFGDYGDRDQARTVEELERAALTGEFSNPEYEEVAKVSRDLMDTFVKRAVGLQTPTPEAMREEGVFLPPADPIAADMDEFVTYARGWIGEYMRRYPDAPFDEVLERSNMFFVDRQGQDPRLISSIVDELFTSGVPHEFGGSRPANTDATNPAAQDQSAYLERMIAERNEDIKRDAEMGLRVGQKNQLENSVDRRPDYILAGIQARRQALLKRPTVKTPMQMRDDGLVTVNYYSKFVQQ